VLENLPNFLARPFSFYGGFVALSTSEKEKYASRQTLFMYKNLIKDLSDANDSNMSTVKFLQDITDEADTKIKDLKNEIDRLHGRILAKDQELTKQKEHFQNKMEKVEQENANEKRSLILKMQ
jgi:hypothetical protein